MAFFSTLYAYLLLTAQLSRAFVNLLYGLWHLNKLPKKPITLFAGGHLEQEDFYLEQAHILAHKFVAAGIPVLSGGCPGVMKLINCGEEHEKISPLTSIVISVKNKKKSGITIKHITIYRFFARKWLLISYSQAFVVFPGGFGTMSELTQTLTLIQTHMRGKAPIILFGTHYWEPFIEWLEKSALKHGLISAQDAALFSVCDDINAIFNVLAK